jgi:hypothetical protein
MFYVFGTISIQHEQHEQGMYREGSLLFVAYGMRLLIIFR